MSRALQGGDWIILDELNLASQTVLEGLNSVLDHRGEVFLAELGKTLGKAPGFRLFGCQNAKDQGNKGRKGLPLSFLNRFVRVYLQDTGIQDLKDIIQQILVKFIPSLDSSKTENEQILNNLSTFTNILLEAQNRFDLPKTFFNIRFFLRSNKMFKIFWDGIKMNSNEAKSFSLPMIFWNLFECLIKPLLSNKYPEAIQLIELNLEKLAGKNKLKFSVSKNDNLKSMLSNDLSCEISNFRISRALVQNNLQLSRNMKQLFTIGSLCSAENLPILCNYTHLKRFN